MVLEPPRLASEPFVAFDEWADAESEVRKAALAYCSGRSSTMLEGTLVRLEPVVWLTWNPPPGAKEPTNPLPRAYLRRVLVCDVAGPRDEGLSDRLFRFETDPPPSPYRLERLVAGPRSLPEETWSIWGRPKGGVQQVLSEEGLLHYGDRRIVEGLALGRAARLGLSEGDDTRAVMLGVVVDLLSIAETLPGQADSTWRLDVQKLAAWANGAPGAEGLEAAVEAREEHRRAVTAVVALRRREGETESLEFVGDRAELVGHLESARRAIARLPTWVDDQAPRGDATKLRAQLAELASSARSSRSRARLQEVASLAAPAIAAARSLRAEIDSAQEDREAEKAGQAERARRRKKEEADAAKDARARDRAFAKQRADLEQKARAHQRHLEKLLERKTTRKGEDVVGALVSAGVVSWEKRTFQEEVVGESRLAMAVHWAEGRPIKRHVVERVENVLVDSTGKAWWPGHLSAWATPPVRQVLEAALSRPQRSTGPVRAALATLPGGGL